MPQRTLFKDTPEKESIRRNIVRHFKQWFKGKKNCLVFSLPGRQWSTEKSIFDHTQQFTRKSMGMLCFEKYYSLEHCRPSWAHEGNDVFPEYGIVNGKFFFPTLDNAFSESPSFVWADYCGTPLHDEIENFKKSVQLAAYESADEPAHGSVIYLTFYLIARHAKTIHKDCLSALRLKNIPDRAPALANALEEIIKKEIGDKFTRILYKFYTNLEGQRGQSPMITIGWHFQKNSPLPVLG